MVQDDSHSTLRESADSSSRRLGSMAMTSPPGDSRSETYFNPATAPIILNFSRQTAINWYKLPKCAPYTRVHPNARPRCHRPENPHPAAIRRTHDHAGARRQGRAASVCLHLHQARAAEGGGSRPLCQGDLQMGRGAGVLSDDRQPRLSAPCGGGGSVLL